MGAVDLAAPAVFVFSMAVVALILIEPRLKRPLPRPVRLALVIGPFVVLTPLVGYAFTDTPFRGSGGGLEVGIVTLRDLTGDAEIVADKRDPTIGAMVLPAVCQRKRPRIAPSGSRPYRGGEQFVCAAYFIGEQDGYVVLGGQDRLYYFAPQDVLRVDLIGPGADNYGVPERIALGPYPPSP